jgi:hypothetical protein
MRFHLDIPDGKLTRHVMEGTLPPGAGVEDLLMHEAAGPPACRACYWTTGNPVMLALPAAAALEVGQQAQNRLIIALAKTAQAAGGHIVLMPESRSA